MAESISCIDCGQPLRRLTPTSYQCSNASCPGGSVHYLCGFCNRPSFSLDKRRCTNPACRTAAFRREPCGTCGNLSLIQLNDAAFCINRRCASNAKRTTTCPACGAASLLLLPAFDVCVKSTCRTLLIPNMKTLPIQPAADNNQTFIGSASGALPTPAPSMGTAVPATRPQATSRETEELPPSPAAPAASQAEDDPYGLGAQPSPPSDNNATRATRVFVRPPRPPPAVTPPPAEPSDGAASMASRSEIEQAYDFIQRTVLAAPDQAMAPIILVFGLAGSGKSTYLTMLGDILANGAGKYHFPYPGVGVRSLRLDHLIDEQHGATVTDLQRELLHRRIRDLIYEYAADNYNEHLINGTWVPATVRETGTDGTAHSFFLLTEIVRDGAILGRLVTIETSGEDYQEVLHNLGRIRSLKELSSPLHRVLFHLVNAAHGIILLLDPASLDNDLDYAPFLRTVKDELEGRAAHALAQHVDRELQTLLTAPAPQQPADLKAVLAHEQADAQQRSVFEAARQRFAGDLRDLAAAIASTPATHEGVAGLASRFQPLLDELELLIRQVSPAFIAHAEEKFACHGRTAANYLFFFDGLLQVLKEDDAFRRAVQMRLDLAEGRTQQTDQILQAIAQQRGIREPLHEAFIRRWTGKETGRRMANLRYLSLVVTKSDRHPIVYPPSDYPKFKLPTCSTHLATLDTYLNLLGGFLRCYNATAIGYAVLRGGQYAPGPGNGFTPVNIVEPLFDMLMAEAAGD